MKKILAESQYRQKAKLFQADITRYDEPSKAPTLLEQLAETKQPVFSSSRMALS